MQIHEITLAPINEGVLQTIGQDIKGAVVDPLKKFQTLATTPGAMTSPTKAAAALDQPERQQADRTVAQYRQQQAAELAQQTKQRARELAQKWTQTVKTQPAVSGTSSVRAAALPTITLGRYGLLTKGPDGIWHDESGAAVLDPAQAAAIDKAFQAQEYRKAQMRQTSIVKEVFRSTSQTAQARKQRAQSRRGTGTVSAYTDPAVKDFVSWSDQQLTDTVTGTKKTLTMDEVRKNAQVKTQLDKILSRIKSNPSDAAAVEEYFTVAMQAMQAMATQTRAQTGQPLMTGDNPLSRIISDRQLQDIKSLAQNPQAARAIKTALGIR